MKLVPHNCSYVPNTGDCFEIDEYGLHLTSVEVFSRAEDASDGDRVSVDLEDGAGIWVSHSSRAELGGNVSRRRGSVVLHFTKEGDNDTSFVIAIIQHKGTEFLQFMTGKDYRERFDGRFNWLAKFKTDHPDREILD